MAFAVTRKGMVPPEFAADPYIPPDSTNPALRMRDASNILRRQKGFHE